jgi:hypothetical protein
MTNRIKTGSKPVSFKPNYVLLEYLDELIRTGLYGSTHTQAVEELLRQRIGQLIAEGELKKRAGNLLDDPKEKPAK